MADKMIELRSEHSETRFKALLRAINTFADNYNTTDLMVRMNIGAEVYEIDTKTYMLIENVVKRIARV